MNPSVPSAMSVIITRLSDTTLAYSLNHDQCLNLNDVIYGEYTSGTLKYNPTSTIRMRHVMLNNFTFIIQHNYIIHIS